jgi:putative transport protein
VQPCLAGIDGREVSADEPGNRAMRHCDGARLACRSGREQDIGERVGIDDRRRRPDDLARIAPFLGHPIEKEIAFDRVLSKKSIVVSRRAIVGKTLGYFNVREVFNVQITRVTRNGIDIPPAPDVRLHLGDVLHAVGDERALENVTRIIGNDVKATYEIGMLPILVGLLVGFALSRLTLPLPLLGNFTLGTTGGVLIAGLLLGSLYSTGPLIWDVPAAGNRLIRDLGLALFMAAVGTAAGGTLLATLQQQGLSLFVAGVAVTLLLAA